MAEEANGQEQTAEEPQEQTPEPETKQEETPAEEDVKDSHGQPGINKERHDKEIAERDARIAELEAQVEASAKEEEARAEFKAEIQKLKEEIADKDLTYQLEKMGCKSPKAAKALLEDYEGDLTKLKEGEPWLFQQEQKGATGLKPGGASDSAEAKAAEVRKALGTEKYHGK